MSDTESDSDENTTNTNSSSSSEDDDSLIEEELEEKTFLKTLSCLKNKDPQIYNENIQFFSQNDDDTVIKNKKPHKEDNSEKPVYLKDYILTKDIDDSEKEEEDDPPLQTYTEEQRTLKESFKNILNEESSEDESNSILLKKKEKDDKVKQEEEKDYIQWLKGKKENLNDKQVENELKPLHDFWNNPNLDEKEQFLKDYILNKRYLERDSQGNYDGSDLSEDEKLIEAQEEFEQNYNLRFENEENKTIKRYPRNIEGSLRRKNDTRKRKREEIKERKKEEKEKKKLEIKRKQKKKLNEVEEKLKKLKEMTGNTELGFGDEEILADFDPEKYDKRMEEIYNDRFYSEDTEGKPDFTYNNDDENWNLDNINMDCDAEEFVKNNETRSKKKRRKKKSAAYTDICDIVKPVFDPEKHSSFQKYVDEYYNLDCEDFIDDIPCRFKYRDVVSNDYGLSVEEILMADDKELNKWVSVKKISKLRPTHVEKNEVKIYKQKGKDAQLKMKLLPSLYNEDKDDDEEEEEKEENIDEEPTNSSLSERVVINNETENKDSKKKHKKQNEENVKITNGKDKNNMEPAFKKRKKFQKYGNDKKNNDPLDKISDNRLRAYNIKPRQFRAKLKHLKQK